MHGTYDDIVIPENTKKLYDECSSLDKKFLFFKYWYHDLVHEPSDDMQVCKSFIAISKSLPILIDFIYRL